MRKVSVPRGTGEPKGVLCGHCDRANFHFEPTLEARAEEMLAFIMPCEEEEDEVNRRKESKRWQDVIHCSEYISTVGTMKLMRLVE